MSARYAPRARDDLRAILAYLDARSPTGARNVRRAIRESAAPIGRHPGIGRISGEGEVRVIPVGRYPYLIYWAVPDGFRPMIVHIRHAAREAANMDGRKT